MVSTRPERSSRSSSAANARRTSAGRGQWSASRRLQVRMAQRPGGIKSFGASRFVWSRAVDASGTTTDASPRRSRAAWAPSLSVLVAPAGVEPAARGLGNRCSVHLSYGGVGRGISDWRGRDAWAGLDSITLRPSAPADAAGADAAGDPGEPRAGRPHGAKESVTRGRLAIGWWSRTSDSVLRWRPTPVALATIRGASAGCHRLRGSGVRRPSSW